MIGDFDFYVGTWDVANRRLTKRLAGSDDWEEFPAVSVARSFFAGAGNFDEITFPTMGFSGATVRLFDPATELWSLYWTSSVTPLALRDPPVVGRFVDGVGEFFADDTFDGVPITVRFRWSDISATTAHWEQAFSVDRGSTWETNWIMDSTRREAD
ncbi:hypothetical protein OHA21_17085 [Actinoplanes sp. NBC_00393]|uniref:hypothetical protein n=1 Tax=Actinoplanes sp. NBC_00393 TaxID=2975953 RepID=UPI002E1F68A7